MTNYRRAWQTFVSLNKKYKKKNLSLTMKTVRDNERNVKSLRTLLLLKIDILYFAVLIFLAIPRSFMSKCEQFLELFSLEKICLLDSELFQALSQNSKFCASNN